MEERGEGLQSSPGRTLIPDMLSGVPLTSDWDGATISPGKHMSVNSGLCLDTCATSFLALPI